MLIIDFCMETKRPIGAREICPQSQGKDPRFLVGAKQIRKAVAAGRTNRVLLAKNADPALTQPIVQLCLLKHIPCDWVSTMAELGKTCGIDVGASAAAIVANGF